LNGKITLYKQKHQIPIPYEVPKLEVKKFAFGAYYQRPVFICQVYLPFPIVVFYPVFVFTAANTICPVLLREIPFHGLLKTPSKLTACFQPRFRFIVEQPMA
jgi:hypothetical protein